METPLRVRAANDADKLTRRFYDRFKKQHAVFQSFVTGITGAAQGESYISLMLNRLMFVYFVQKQGFLDGNCDYLRDRRRLVQAAASGGGSGFHDFLRCFLRRLFPAHCQPTSVDCDSKFVKLLGNVPRFCVGQFNIEDWDDVGARLKIADEAFDGLFDFFDRYQWHLDDSTLLEESDVNPDIIGFVFEKLINQKQMGAYYTKSDVTEYISKNTIIPFLFDAAKSKHNGVLPADHEAWRLLTENPTRYISNAVGHGIFVDANSGQALEQPAPIPQDIAAGIIDVRERCDWNQVAPSKVALPGETWREVIARRRRCEKLLQAMKAGEVADINQFITWNLDLSLYARDVIASCDSPDLLRGYYSTLAGRWDHRGGDVKQRAMSVLDPTCGSGAFLFAALKILQPLYDACLDKMESFADDSEFGKIREDVARYPGREFFILQAIIGNNLFGVDIMPEAVEICKLRLLLKLISAVAPLGDQVNVGLRRLADLQFNIHAGNTLVGYASWEEVAASPNGTLGLERIRELSCENTPGRKSHRGQLSDELDVHLSEAFDVDPSDSNAIEVWRKSHQPFHWCTEFHPQLANGGFDVCIGNPPYVEASKVRSEYSLRGYQTASCGNLYALTFEKSMRLLHQKGRIGLIVPLSLATTERMRPLQEMLNSSRRTLWLSHFDVYPCKLFDGAKQRLTIALLSGQSRSLELLTTRYNRWRPDERQQLFPLLSYMPGVYSTSHSSYPKHQCELEVRILEQLARFPAGELISDARNPDFFVHRIPYNYVKAFDFVPYFWNEVDGEKKSEDYKPFRAMHPEHGDSMLAALNSNLFFWWWYVLFEGYHCGRHEIYAFPAGLSEMSESTHRELAELARQLMADLNAHKNRKKCVYKSTGRVEYDEFFPRLSKPVIDKIDAVLGRHFGLSDEMVDYVVNYGIKYRMGGRAV